MPLSGQSLPEQRALSLVGESLASLKTSNKANGLKLTGKVGGVGGGRSDGQDVLVGPGDQGDVFGFTCE